MWHCPRKACGSLWQNPYYNAVYYTLDNCHGRVCDTHVRRAALPGETHDRHCAAPRRHHL
jgi:hypothetical protein